MTEFIKKITCRTVGCEAKAGESFVIMGKLRRGVMAVTNFGEYVRFGGDFEAVNEATGEVFRSAVFLCPGIMEDVLHSALQSAQETDKTASAEFALRFSTKEDKSAARGYVWTAEFLLEAATDDPLTRLRAAIEDQLKLPAPEKKKAAA